VETERFVGRRDQLAWLDRVVRSAEAGEPQLVVIGGDAGIGKSALMGHLADRLDETGWRVLRTACIELGTEGLPLAPLTQALRLLVEQLGADSLDPTLLHLLPEFGRAGHDRARLFELYGALLQRLGSEHPLLWIVDDLHWADRSTRELLGFLARTLRASAVLIVTAYRADDLDRSSPLRPFLAELRRVPGVHRFELPGLTRAETAELLRETLGRRPADDLVDRVHRRSGGNALMAIELALSDGGVPESLRDLLLARIDLLPETARYVVQRAAIGGRSIPHGLLAAISGLPEDELFKALRVAADQRVLLPDAGRYQFRHALLREAVVGELLPAERTRLHRICAEALEADPSLVAADAYAAELAYHWNEAGDAVKAFPALFRAADEAGRVPAYSERAQQLGRALVLWPRVPDAAAVAGTDRLGLFEAAVEAAGWSADSLQVLDLVDRAAEIADRGKEPERLAMLFGQRAMALHDLGRDGAVTAAEEALQLLPAEPVAARARVLDLLGAVFTLRGRLQQALETAEECARLAASVGEESIEIAARTTYGWALSMLGSYDESLAALQAAQRQAEAVGEQRQLVRIHLNSSVALQGLGRLQEAVDIARRGLDGAAATGLERGMGPVLSIYLASSLASIGRWDEALVVAGEGLDLDPAGMAAAALHTVRAEIAFGRGDVAAARELLALAGATTGVEITPWMLPAIRLRAEIELAEGHLDEAAATVGGALAVARERGALLDTWALVTTAARISTAIPGLRETADGLRTDSPVLAAYSAQFNAELGAATWLDVVAAWEAIGHAEHTSYAELRAAQVALSTGDRVTARDQLRSAAARCEQLGAVARLREIEVLARGGHIDLGTEPGTTPRVVRPAGLTERETEVLRLVAAGKSNKQIADELFVSAKTVSVHVSNVLAKFGVSSRGEAAAVAHRLRLFEE